MREWHIYDRSTLIMICTHTHTLGHNYPIK